MADELYDVRNTLLVGNYHQVIAEASSIRTVKKKPEDVQAFNVDRDLLVGRAQVGLGQYDAVIAEHRNTSHPSLVALRYFAEVSKEMSGLPLEASSAKIAALTALAGGTDPAVPIDNQLADVAVLASAGLVCARNIPDALAFTHRWAFALPKATYSRQLLELRAVMADCYLRLNRPDVADKEVAQMKAIDDESSLAILMGGIVSLRMAAVKSERIGDALSSFQEINSRCGTSVAVLNLIALANITKGNLKDAERNLLDALSKKSGDPDTVANLAVVAAQLGKSAETTSKYAVTARAAQPQSAWGQQLVVLEKRFAEAAAAQ